MTDGRPAARRGTRAVLRDRAFRATFLLGVAAMAAVDEIVFHQLLGWHHFYDGSTPRVGILTDGLLHAFELVAAVAGVFLLLDARRTAGVDGRVAGAGLGVGAGVFQLWDGVVDHKVLRLHQVRYDVELLPYDLAWNLSGLALLAVGVVLVAVAARRPVTG
jgi:uncharacterized membrane protein